MIRSAVFVDAGYVFAEGSQLLTGSKQRREAMVLDIPKVVDALRNVARAQCDLPLLRIYWYDALRHGRATVEQQALADADDIKVRFGQLNFAGEQKGVDALIVTDMVELARNRAISDAVLLSGDEDVRVGVLLAQQFGVRVHLIGIAPSRSNQSRALKQEADTTTEWDKAAIAGFLSEASASSADTSTAAGPEARLAAYAMSLSDDERADLRAGFESSTQIPSFYDREILRLGRLHYGEANLTDVERSHMRQVFIRLVKAGNGSAA